MLNIVNMIVNMLRAISTQAMCLINVPVAEPYDGYLYPGQSWLPDDQCKQIYGSVATFCKVS